MKQEYTFICDAGALMIGHPDFVVRIPNEFGDGSWRLVVLSSDEQFDAYDEGYTFRGTIDGHDMKVFSYDCLNLKRDGIRPEDVLCTLDGSYFIYARLGDTGDMLLHQRRSGGWSM